MRKIIRFTRGSRRTFAKKARPSVASLRNQLTLRGGGYL